MSIPTAEVDAAFDALLLIWKNWNRHPEKMSQEKMDDFLSHLIDNGWERKHIYHLLQKTSLPADYHLPPEAIDYICNVESGVIGFCSPSCITRFPNEPFNNDEEMTACVRSNAWKK